MKENSLTERQVRLAEEHYGELSRFLSAHNLSEDKFYDVVVFGFLDAVREYDERGDEAFRRVAEHHMKNSLRMHFEEQKEKENSKFAAEKKDISFGSQIRSYVFCPYTMVKDHRTKFSVGNIQGVMDGDLDEFMNAYLVAKWKGLPMDGAGDDDEEV